jgi:hypothetical protein
MVVHPSDIDGEMLRLVVVNLADGSSDEGYATYYLFGRARFTDGRLLVVPEGDGADEPYEVPESAWPRIRRIEGESDPASTGGCAYTVGMMVRQSPADRP